MEASIGKRCVAEMLGTLTLVFIGCGSAVIAGEYIGFTGISLAFGLSVLAMVYAVGPISGCHINPAISIGMLAAGKMKARDAVLYIIMQCIGGIIAAGILLAIASGRAGYSLAVGGLGQNGYGVHSPAGYALGACFIAEIVLTAIFLLVVFGSTSEKAPKGFAGVAIGFALAFIHLVGIPVTGTSVNPARSLGPAVFAGGAAVSQVWLFFAAPVIGALIAAMIWKYALARD